MAWLQVIASAGALLLGPAVKQNPSPPALFANVTITLERGRAKAVTLDRKSPLAVLEPQVLPSDNQGETRIRLQVRCRTEASGKLLVGNPITESEDLDLRYFTEVETILGPDIVSRNRKGERTFVTNPYGLALDGGGTLYVGGRMPQSTIYALRGNVLEAFARVGDPCGLKVNGGHLYAVDGLYSNFLRFSLADGQGEHLAGDGRPNAHSKGMNPKLDGMGRAVSFGLLNDVAFLGGTAVLLEGFGTKFRVATNLAHERTQVRSVAFDMPENAPFNMNAFDAISVGGKRFVVAIIENSVVLVDLNTRQIQRIAGTGALGLIDGPGDMAKLSKPISIAVAANVIFIGEYGSHRIRQITLDNPDFPFNPASWTVKTIAGNGKKSTNDGSGEAASFYTPSYLTGDGNGTVYVSETDFSRVRKITVKEKGRFPLAGRDGMAKIVSSEPTGTRDPRGTIYELKAGGETTTIELTVATQEPVLSFQIPLFSFEKPRP